MNSEHKSKLADSTSDLYSSFWAMINDNFIMWIFV